MAPTAAVIGPGAIGASVAACVQRAGLHPVLCGRTPLDTITVRPDDAEPVELSGGVRTDPADVAGPVDWLLLAVKAHQTEGASGWLRALAGPGTTVVVLQNGVEHRERVAPFVGGATVLPSVVWCPAEFVDRHTVRLRATVRLSVPDEPVGHRLAELLRPGGAEVNPVPDFVTELWQKLAVNAVAGLMVLTGRRAGMYRRNDVHGLAVALARECLAVAAAEGATPDAGMAERIADQFAAYPPDLGTSIQFDRAAGRPLEWDARNGVISRLGARHGIATPISEILVPLLAAASDDPN